MPRDDGNVVPLRSVASKNVATDDLRNPLVQLGLGRTLSRFFKGHVTSTEFSLLDLVKTCSVDCGKLSFKTTYRQIEHGPPGIAGIGKGRSTISAMLSSLKTRGILLVLTSGTDGIEVAINWDWTPACTNTEGKTVLSVPKRLAKVVEDEFGEPVTRPENWTTPVQNSGLPPSEKLDYIIRTELEPTNQNKNREAALSPRPDLSDLNSQISGEEKGKDVFRPKSPPYKPAVAIGTVVTQLDGPAKVKSGAEKGRTPEALMATWRAVFTETYADIPTAVHVLPTENDFHKLRSSLVKKWDGSTESMHAFVAFVVREWPFLRKRAFKWMDREPPPVYPTFSFFASFHRFMLPLWSADHVGEWLSSIPDREKRLYAKLTRSDGLTHEEAMTEIGRSRARSEMQAENEAMKEYADQRERVALVALEQADRKTKHQQSVHNPHPNAPVARRPVQSTPVPNYFEDENLQPVALLKLDDIPEWKDDDAEPTAR